MSERKNQRDLVSKRVDYYYRNKGYNCAITMLKILAEVYEIDLEKQVLAAAAGMHGAGKYRAQCGLVEGGLMFAGILGKKRDHDKNEIEESCYNFASKFEEKFGSLSCEKLRPEGFNPDNPSHLCEDLTIDSVIFAIDYFSGIS